MQQEQVNTSVLDKVKKLLALQSSTTSEAEAQNCAARIQEILFKHNLDMATVINHELKAKTDMIRQDCDLNPLSGKSDSDWVERLLHYVAITHLCMMVKTNDGSLKGLGTVLGRPDNVQIVYHLFDYLVPTIKRIASSTWASYSGPEKKNTFKRGFYRGCVGAIYHRLQAQQRSLEVDNSQITSLVVQNKAVLRDFAGTQFGALKQKSGTTKISGNAGLSLGRQAGQNISLNKQMGGSSSKNMLN